MPRVPTYDNFQTTPSLSPNVKIDGSQALENSGIAGRQLQDFGRAQSSAASAGFEIASDIQKQADQVRIDDALNKLQEQRLKLTYDKDVGFSSIMGESALNRPGGKSLANEYVDKLKESSDEISQSLATDQQKRIFELHANDVRRKLDQAVTEHETQQFREYSSSVREGTIRNNINEIGLNFRNPKTVDDSLNSIGAAVYDMGKLSGKSADWIDSQTREMTSKAHKTAITSALQQDDPAFAFDYLKKHSKEMTADDIVSVNGVLTKDFNAKLAYNTASSVISSVAPRMDTSDGDRAFNITLAAESGTKHFDQSGTPITSPKGAIGIAQIMPATGPEAAKLAGIPWDENKFKNDEDYNRALGKAYFGQQLKDFGGNLAQTFAAYNAGPTATREAIKQADIKGNDWLSNLPAETQNYVRNNMNSFASGKGQYKTPTEIDVVNAVKDKIGDNNPQLLRTAVDEALRQYEVMKKSVATTQETNVATAMQTLMENGGNYTALPADIRGAIPAEKIGSVMDFASKIAKGQPVETDWELYYKLKTDPTLLGKTNLMAFRNKLSDVDFKNLTSQQQDLRSGKTDTTTELRSNKEIFDNFLNQSGINPSPKQGAKDAWRQIGSLWSDVQQRINSQEMIIGRKLNKDEIQKTMAQMFTNVRLAEHWYGDTNKPAALVTLNDIPTKDRKQIIDALKIMGREPTDDLVRATYLRSKGAS